MKNNLEEVEKKIEELESVSRQLDFTSDESQRQHNKVLNFARKHLDALPDLKAYKTPQESVYFDHLDEFQEEHDFEEILEIYDNEILGGGINAASAGHLGYIPGGGLEASALGDYIASITNVYSGIYLANPGAVKLENQLIAWMSDLMGYPKSSSGNLTSGGSIAHLIAITTARDRIGVLAQDFHKLCIYITPQTHHCIHKALIVSGLREAQIRNIEMNSSFGMDPKHLTQQIEIDRKDGNIPFLVVATVGTTDVGAVDPIDDIANVLQGTSIWFSVDAAYGGFFKLVSSMKHHFRGIERSDAIILDPHKSLFLPYGSGAVIIKDKDLHQKSFQYQASYLVGGFDENEISPADLSPELTRHFRALRLWFPLKLHGLTPFSAALEEKHLLAIYFYKRVQKLGFEVGPPPAISTCIFRIRSVNLEADNRVNERILEFLKQDGTIFLSATVIDDVFWLRFTALVFRTHKREVDLLLKLLKTFREKSI